MKIICFILVIGSLVLGSSVFSQELPDFNNALLDVGKPVVVSCPNCEAQKAQTTQCDLKGPREELKLIPKDWGLISTGADLLKKDSLVQGIDYKYSLGVVDSGLMVRGNPKAGTLLSADSPERETDIHGTHVIGTASSLAHGVNPKLPAKMFPVIHNSWEGVKTEVLMNALDKAIQDPKVKVINMSWSFTAHPKMVNLVQDAINKGKWIVYAAGNEDQMANVQTAGHDKFISQPGFFKVGAFSYFGSPSYFSNFGPDVTIYAPGSRINSLHAGYNSNHYNSQTSTMLDGTSMASPHFSSVLTTLANVAPDLKVEDMQALIKITSINRGTKKRPFPFLNAFLALETLKHALPCLKGSEPDSTCLTKSLDKIKASVKIPNKPKANDKCADWTKYYESLRKAYFLSKGGDNAIRAIDSLFAKEDRPVPERFLFQNSTSQNSNSKRYLSNNETPGVYDNERKRALSFLSGGLVTPKTEASTEAGKKHPLELLMPSKENFSEYLKHCQKAFDNNGSTPMFCFSYLLEAPTSFKEIIIDHILNLKKPVTNFHVLVSLKIANFNDNKSKLKILYKRALDACLNPGCDYEDLNEFYDDSFFDFEEKKLIAKKLHEIAKAGKAKTGIDADYAKSWEFIIEMTDADANIKDQAIKLRDLLSKGERTGSIIGNRFDVRAEADEPEAISIIRYLTLRAEFGMEVDEVKKVLDLALPPKSNFQFTKHRPQEGHMLKSLIIHGQGNAVVELITEENGLDRFLKMPLLDLTQERMFEMLFKSESVSLEHKNKLAAIIKAAASKDTFIVIQILRNLSDVPVLADMWTEVKSPEGAKLYPALARQFLWEKVASGDKAAFNLILEQDKFKPNSIFNFKAKDLQANPQGANRVKSQLRKFASEELIKDESIFLELWVESLDQNSIIEFGPDLLKALPNLIKSRNLYLRQLVPLIQKFVSLVGSNEAMMKSLIKTLSPLIEDESFLWETETNQGTKSKAEVMAYQEKHGLLRLGASNLIEGLLLVYNSQAGRELLKHDPIWEKLLALKDHPMKVGVPLLSNRQLGEIPPKFRHFFRPKITHYLKKAIASGYIRYEFQNEIVHDPEYTLLAANLMKEASQDSDTYRTLGYYIEEACRLNPQTTPLILKAIEGKELVLFERVDHLSTKKVPMAEHLKRYLDYEK